MWRNSQIHEQKKWNQPKEKECWRQSKASSASVDFICFPVTLQQGKRRVPRFSGVLGSLARLWVSVCFKTDMFGHQSFQLKGLGCARNMKSKSSPDGLLQLVVTELREMAPILSLCWPACFIPPSQSSHFSLLPLFCHLGYINGEMGRNHSNYLEN